MMLNPEDPAGYKTDVTASATACSTSDMSAIQVVAIFAFRRHPRFVNSDPTIVAVLRRSSVTMSPGDNMIPGGEGIRMFR